MGIDKVIVCTQCALVITPVLSYSCIAHTSRKKCAILATNGSLSLSPSSILHLPSSSSVALLLVLAPVMIRFVSRAIALTVVSNMNPIAVSKYIENVCPHRLVIARCVSSVCMSVCVFVCL